MMRYRLWTAAILLWVTAVAAGPEEDTLWSMDSARLELDFRPQILSDLGLQASGSPRDPESLQLTLHSGPRGTVEFAAPKGYFERLVSGSLAFDALSLSLSGDPLFDGTVWLAPGKGHPPSFVLRDQQGVAWLSLAYGHFVVSDDRLDVMVMDVQVTESLAQRLGSPALAGVVVGDATLSAQVNRPPGVQANKGSCPSLVWPTQPGVEADIAMTAMDAVSQTTRLNGRVAITPSAYFENISSNTADIPWFGMFANPTRDPTFCKEAGGGTCQPYANDQGGILVWSVYRLAEGRLEQLGRSGAKHAFNSVNFDNNSAIPCDCPGSGRIVSRGCEDLYNVSTNAHRDFLGPRDEITAHTGIWQRDGSIFDRINNTPNDGIPDGTEMPDGVCDHPSSAFLGSVRCQAPAADALDRRMHVAEADLETPGARYFIESWYVVRDDINIFNSMGFREIAPSFSTIWTFGFVGPFVNGPVIDAIFPEGSDAERVSSRVDTGEGRLQTVVEVTPVGNLYRYEIFLMNFDFDRKIRRIEMPLPVGAMVTDLYFHDGDADAGNDWQQQVDSVGSVLAWTVQSGNPLDWGSAFSFSFTSNLPPVAGDLTLDIQEVGASTMLTRPGLVMLDDIIHSDGFED
jgi:hypothetical protein